MYGAKKVVGAAADRKFTGSPAEQMQSPRLGTTPRPPWPWPRAAMTIILLSLLMWGGVVAIALLAFD